MITMLTCGNVGCSGKYPIIPNVHYALDWLRDSRPDFSSLSISITIITIDYLYLYYLFIKTQDSSFECFDI